MKFPSSGGVYQTEKFEFDALVLPIGRAYQFLQRGQMDLASVQVDEGAIMLALTAAAAFYRKRRHRERARLYHNEVSLFNSNSFSKEACFHLFRFEQSNIIQISTYISGSISQIKENT